MHARWLRNEEEDGGGVEGTKPSARIGHSRRLTVVLEGEDTVCKHSVFTFREYDVGIEGEVRSSLRGK